MKIVIFAALQDFFITSDPKSQYKFPVIVQLIPDTLNYFYFQWRIIESNYPN